MDATLQVIRIEPRLSADPVSEPDYLLTEMDGDRVVKSMRYGDADVARYGIERVRQWVTEDLQRYREWERSQWQFVDVRLVAVVEVFADVRQVGTLEIDGPALGGVESDAGDDYMSETVRELAEEFRHELAGLGFVTQVDPSAPVWEA
jgi:hypothetical protein